MPKGVERRINMSLSEELFNELQTISEESGLTMTEVIKSAFGLYKWFHEARQEKARVTICRNGKDYELDPRF
jgi:hypothetical protein